MSPKGEGPRVRGSTRANAEGRRPPGTPSINALEEAV